MSLNTLFKPFTEIMINSISFIYFFDPGSNENQKIASINFFKYLDSEQILFYFHD